MSQAGTLNSSGSNSNVSAQQLIIRGPEVDFTATGNTNIYTFPADFIFTGIVLTATAVTGSPNADYQFNLGWTAPNYTNIATGYLSTGGPSAINFEIGTPLGVVLSDFSRIPAGQTLVIRITTAESVATVYTLRVDIQGYYFAGSAPIPPGTTILGRSGAKVDLVGTTYTVRSPDYGSISATGTSVMNTGEFVTGAFTRTLPASASLEDGDELEFVCTSASALVVQSVGTQKIRLGNLISAAAGTATSTAIGDSISLRFRSADGFWYATSSIGNWTIA